MAIFAGVVALPSLAAEATANAPPVFPTHTTTHDPRLGRSLNPATPLPPYFSSTRALSRTYLFARKHIETVRRELGSKHWRLEIRTTCPVEYGGNVFVEGRAIVRDSENRVRFLGESVGSGDSAGIWKFYYDDASRLRSVVFEWRSYTGAKANGVALFDATGTLQSCGSRPGDSGVFCPYVEPEGLNPDVKSIVKPEVLERNVNDRRAESPVVWALRMDPVAEFSKCNEPYRPKR